MGSTLNVGFGSAQNCEVMITPGPGAYNVAGGTRVGGGKFSDANPLSDLDWTISRSKTIPGPSYQPAREKIGGGRFSTAKPKGELDWIVYRSKHIPGPSQYGTPEMVTMEGGVLFGPDGGPGEFTNKLYVTTRMDSLPKIFCLGGGFGFIKTRRSGGGAGIGITISVSIVFVIPFCSFTCFKNQKLLV